jgi:pyruvate-formate lyase
MNDRTHALRQQSLDAVPTISEERAVLLTAFYAENQGRWSTPVLRGRAFAHLCEHKSLWIGDGELIVGERGPEPKATPTYPELTCHSLEDLRILDSRAKTWYRVSEECLRAYEDTVIPFWKGRSLRDRMMAMLPEAWHRAYDRGVFTEFMEQRAPGHTVLDGKIYGRGLRDFQDDIAGSMAALDPATDPEALDKREALEAMAIASDGLIRFAERHADLAEALADEADDADRRRELQEIAAICRRVPAHAPRTFHEALQSYWFCHLGVITELNGWDAFNPGHLDQHLLPFYEADVAAGRLTPEAARELLECFFVKFNNHLAPPKVGVTAAESGTYTDFANINLGGLLENGADGSNPLTHVLLDIIDDMHLLQPSSNLQLSRKTPNAVLEHTLEVVRKGYGFPSIFNADAVVEEQIRQGKTFADARAGGCSGCVEVGAFGKEAYILTGYFNLVKILELALNDGVDPVSGDRLGPATGTIGDLTDFEALFAAYTAQLRHLVDVKIRGNQLIERLYAVEMPAPFLSVLIDDCIDTGRDYNAGGARYNNTYIQAVGIGTITDSLAAIRTLVFEDAAMSLMDLQRVLAEDFADEEPLRQRLLNRMPKYGNDDDRADDLMVRRVRGGFRGHRRPTQHQGRRLPHRDAAHHLPRLLRLGVRRDARRSPGRKASVRGHLPGPGRRSQRAHGGPELGGQDGPRADRRHAAEPEVHTVAAGGRRGRPEPRGAGAILLRHGRPPRPVQRGHCRHPASRPGGSRGPPGSHRARGRLLGLLLRPVRGTAGGDHRPHGARSGVRTLVNLRCNRCTQ